MSQRIRWASHLFDASRTLSLALGLCAGLIGIAGADPQAGAETGASPNPPASAAQPPVPRGSVFSSLKQAFNQDFDHDVVRGHFDVGSAPDTHRYYCLVDPKTGKGQPNGVAGQPVSRPDGMTGIRDGAVSFYSCVAAEQQGILVTEGYLLSAGARGIDVPAPQTQRPARAAAVAEIVPDKIDVAGVTLGMSVDEVRAVLKTKRLFNFHEAMAALDPPGSARDAMKPVSGGRFVSVITAWTAAEEGGDEESFEVMFTPVPGKERALAIVHSAGYSPANPVHEMALEAGLVRKYGGFAAPNELPPAPTWRFQGSGGVQVGDPCDRRGMFGGLRTHNAQSAVTPNVALVTAPDEFHFQIDHCGSTIVTEDHVTANVGAPREDRLVTRFTVTAYSPSLALEGATAAAKLLQSAANAQDNAGAGRSKDQSVLNL